MKTFQFKNWEIAIGFIPFLCFGIMPKIGEEDNTLIMISLIFIAIGIEVPCKENKESQLLTAIVKDWRIVEVLFPTYQTPYLYKTEKNINELNKVYLRLEDGRYAQRTRADFYHTPHGYIIRGRKNNDKIIAPEDEVYKFVPGAKVKGYIKRGIFITIN